MKYNGCQMKTVLGFTITVQNSQIQQRTDERRRIMCLSDIWVTFPLRQGDSRVRKAGKQGESGNWDHATSSHKIRPSGAEVLNEDKNEGYYCSYNFFFIWRTNFCLCDWYAKEMQRTSEGSKLFLIIDKLTSKMKMCGTTKVSL